MQRLSEAENAVLGGSAAAIEAVILQPTLYWKNAAQQGLPFSTDPKILYRGMGAALWNEAGSTGIQFMLTGMIKHLIVGEETRAMTPWEDMSSALLGGGIGALYTSPVELMMIQQQVRNKPLIDTAKETVTRFGLTSGVYRGFVAAVARDSIYVGGMLGVTPIIQNVLMEEHEMGISSSGFVASMVGGIAAAVLTCPADVVNTCMKGDLAGTTYGTLTQTLKTLWADGGLKRYFSGVHWRCANITGTILIVNEARMRLAPIMFPESEGEAAL